MQQLFTLDSYASSIARKFGREILDVCHQLEKSAINVQAFYRSFRYLVLPLSSLLVRAVTRKESFCSVKKEPRVIKKTYLLVFILQTCQDFLGKLCTKY